jgi:hypothetical protein
MDSYLEGYLWPDVHSALANKIRQQLTPLLRPNYTARLDVCLAEDSDPTGEIGILYPNVEVLKAPARQPLPPLPSGYQSTLTITPPGLASPVVQPVAVRLTNVEIRDAVQNRLITSIEILSPVNKREPGLTTYRQKRQRLYQAAVHLLELDLLRRGTRPFAQPRLPTVPYCIALTRAQAKQMELWPLELATPLPVVPVPLKPEDEDIPLDLQHALTQIYDEAAYDLSLNYSPPPPPALAKEEAAWMQTQVKVAKA